MSNGNEFHGDEDDYIPPPEYDEETDLSLEEREIYKPKISTVKLFKAFYIEGQDE